MGAQPDQGPVVEGQRYKLKHMYKGIFLIYSLFILNLFSMAQPSDAYKNMLKKYYKNTVPFIAPDSLQSLTNTSKNYVLLDTRERNEYKVSHIANARYVGYDNFSLKTVKDIPKNTPIIVYCSIGARSEHIGEILLKEGFKEVYNLYGGIFNWVNLKYPLVSNKGDTTENIHPYNEDWGKWLQEGNKVY